jgi:hypothetical protein
VFCFHSGTEPVRSFTLEYAGLECSFHFKKPSGDGAKKSGESNEEVCQSQF